VNSGEFSPPGSGRSVAAGVAVPAPAGSVEVAVSPVGAMIDPVTLVDDGVVCSSVTESVFVLLSTALWVGDDCSDATVVFSAAGGVVV
jgi:hypothetical protein